MKMGNNESVSAGNKAQADSTACEWYRFLALTGEGEFVDMMKRCSKSRDYTEVDNAIKEKVTPYLYNSGNGKLVPVSEIVRIRNCIRNGQPVVEPTNRNFSKPIVRNGTSRVGPTRSESNDDRNDRNGAADIEHNGVEKKKESMRLVCWDLYKRGPVGESLIHLCILLATPLTLALAKRLLKIYPKMLVDIYLSDQYFGENILHMAIVNEDPSMVKFILDKDEGGLCCKERAFGVFFSCDDQIASRKDRPDVETLEISPKTNYKGYLYWGEYPLSFAACLQQEECLRLLFAKNADPTAQDHNGNTILHMLVIHNRLSMFDLVLDMSPPNLLCIKNNKGLTPLTLAAALAHQEIYNHLMKKEREVYWVYGDVTCAAYPLEKIDTIGENGEINTTSALHLIINGDKAGHLEMVDGMIVNLLNEKWKTFLRERFYLRMVAFLVYFVIFLAALMLRPGKDPYSVSFNETASGLNETDNETYSNHTCFLLTPPPGVPYRTDDIVRLTLESLTLLGVVTYLTLAFWNVRYTGKDSFLEMLGSDPGLSLFYVSCLLVVLMVPGRFLCSVHSGFRVYEDILAVFAILTSSGHFLFFFRGFKIVGPFVVMIYKMVKGDLLRFITIYLIFLIGFSQSMYIVFLNPKEHIANNLFVDAGQAIVAMFYMSMGEFADVYDQFELTNHELIGKFIFVVYMLIVTILLINMLIAMMGNTYTLVNEAQKEHLRQWAQIVLAIEKFETPDERLKQQKKYSQPMADGKRRALAIRWHQTEAEKEELKKAREETKIKQREVLMKYVRQQTSSRGNPSSSLLALPAITPASR